jgi:hypothetical protein
LAYLDLQQKIFAKLHQFSPSFYCSLETCPSRSCCVLQGNMMNTKQINKTFLVNTFNRILSLAKYFRLASDTDIFQNKSKNRPLFQAFWFFVCSRGNRKKKEMFFRKESKTQLLIWSLNRTPWIINAKNTPKKGKFKEMNGRIFYIFLRKQRFRSLMWETPKL